MAMIRNLAITVLLVTAMCYALGVAAQPGDQRSKNSPAMSTAAVLGLPKSDGPVLVHTAFHLLNISDINDQSETVAFSGILTLTRKDKRQAFDPAKEGVSEKIYQGAYQVNEIFPAWYPQVTLINASDNYKSQAVLFRVKSDRTNTLTETVNATMKVSLDLRRYPFDLQQLEAIFRVVGFDASEVVLEAESR